MHLLKLPSALTYKESLTSSFNLINELNHCQGFPTQTCKMSSTDTTSLTAIAVDEGIPEVKAKSINTAASRPSLFARLFRKEAKLPGRRWRRGLLIFDFFLRLFAIATLIAAAGAMGNADETLPFFTHGYQFHANFADLPALLFLVIGDAIAAGYLCFSIPISIISIIRPSAICPRLFLLIFDLVAVALTMAASSTAAAIVYLAHTGNTKANWVAICVRFQDFCQQSSGAVVASFVGTALLLFMVVISALVLRRN